MLMMGCVTVMPVIRVCQVPRCRFAAGSGQGEWPAHPERCRFTGESAKKTFVVCVMVGVAVCIKFQYNHTFVLGGGTSLPQD
jgi:hypothetical protein